MNYWRFTFSVAFFCICAISHAQYFDFNNRCKQTYELIFNLRFDAANDSLSLEKSEHPDNLIPYYLNHYILFLKTFIGEEVSDFNQLKSNHETVITKIKGTAAHSPWKNYCLAETYLLTAFSKLKFKEYFTAALQVKKGYALLEENQKLYPEFKPTLKALGVLHAFIGAVPENYQWLVKIAGMGGNVNEGLSEIESVYRATLSPNSRYHFLNRETGFIFLFTRQHLKPDLDRSLLFLDSLNLDDQKPLDLFFTCNLYYSAGKSEAIIKLIQNKKSVEGEYPVHYLNYIMGMSKLTQLDYSAFTYFNNYVKQHNGNSFIKSAFQKMAWIRLLQADTIGYQNYLNQIQLRGNDFTDEDKQAQAEATTRQMPDIILLKARLLFDGGNFNEALQFLARQSISQFESDKEKLEYTYRLARIYDKLKMTDRAIQQYQLTINNGKHLNFYFAAASCNFLAQLYENLGKVDDAERYYKLCLSLRNHEYQNSLDQKAKAGLSRIGKS
jgi:hypothetical protein